jgi:hypothetical protein
MQQASYSWKFHAMLAALGFVPIGCLCFALFGWMSLQFSTRVVVLPALAMALIVGLRYPTLGWLALQGLGVGMLATAIYDLVRLTFVLSGAWNDFIPVIGRLALGDPQASPFWGYLWRYLGDGGAMGVTFVLLPWRGLRAGLIFGALICGCLFATLLLAPGAQQVLFPLSPLTAGAALVGHLIYGGFLGWYLPAWMAVPQLERPYWRVVYRPLLHR